MPKWLVVLLAIAALAGIIVLDQVRPSPVAPSPIAPPAVAPVAQPPVTPTPAAPAAPSVPPETVSPAVASPPVQTAPRVVAPSSAQTAPAAPPPVVRPPQTPSSTVPPVVPAVDARWAGLSVHEFLLRASGDLVRLSPETVTYLGISQDLGLRDDRLDPLTVEAETETYALAQATLSHLATYDLADETAEVRLNAETYRAWLEDLLAGRPFSDNGYAVSSYMDSYPTYVAWFLTSLHPLDTPAHVEDYLSRLGEIPTRFRELQTRLAMSEKLAAVPPRFMLEQAVDQLRAFGEGAARDGELYTALAAALDGMTDVDRDDVLARAEALLEREVLPAYRELGEFVSGMALRASDDAGVWKQANGDAYYAYCLRSMTTTDLTAAEIYDLGVREVARIEGEVRAAAPSVGLDATLPIPALFAALAQTTGSSIGAETLSRCQKIIDDIGPRIAPAFLRMPTRDLVVVDGGLDTYFSAGTLDGSRPGQFFMPTQSPQPIYGLPTVTFHEAIPGHGLQAAYAYESDIPPYIAGISFTAYAEGWALYAERLAWELGAYAENPHGNLGRLQDELFRAVRLVVDTGIHAKRWTVEQAVDYMLDHTGFDEPYVRSEVERYIVLPAQAVTYKIGMLTMLELRDRAQQALGERFHLAAFHDVILGHGELPLWLLERRVDEFIADALRDGAETSAP